MNRIFSFLVVVMVTLMTGCSFPTSSWKIPTTKQLVGTWIFNAGTMTTIETISIPGRADSSFREDYSSISFKDNNDSCILKSDSTYVLATDEYWLYDIGVNTSTGNWTLAGDSLNMLSSSDNSLSFVVSVDGKSGMFIQTKVYDTPSPLNNISSRTFTTTVIISATKR